MTQQNINIGTAEQTGDGESIRSAFSKIEDNFTELYTDVAANAQAAIEVNDLTSSVTWANVPDANITQSSVTQHQASLALTASQVSDFVSVVQANEINDLTGTVTWANVPDANITESSVTQHQEALAITLSQITDIGSSVFLTNIQNESIGDLSDVDLTGIANGSILSWNSTSGKFEIAPIGIQLTSLSVTAPAEAFGSGGVDYNNVSGTFTYTPPDLSTYITAESDTFQTVTSRGSTTTNTVDFQSGVIATAVSSSNAALHSIGFDEANPMGIGSTIGVNIVGGAGAPINIGTSPSGTVTIGSGSNTVDYPAGTTVDFTGATVTGTSFLTSETTTTLGINANILKYTDETGAETDIDLSLYLDDTNLARLTTGTLNGATGIATFTRDDATTFTVDFSDLLNQSEANDLTASVTWANVPDANITQSSVTQHQAALSITESQISDLQSYLTAETDPVFTAHTTSSIVDGTGFLKNTAGVWSYDNSTYLTSETSHADVLVDGDFATAGFMKTDGAGNYTVDNSTYLTSFTETNDLTAAVTWANVPDANITQSSVTQHQAALSITESQISDLQSYLTAVSEAQVTAHQAALSITESQISDFGTYLTTVAFADLTSKPTTLSGYGITDAATAAQGALADTALQSYTETNDLSSAVTWANVPDANITQSSVTQHQAALSITESQISDLQAYLTAETDPVYLAEKGQPNGVATLDATGIIPSSQLPSYVDDVLSYANFAAFPVTGETGKIYVDQATGDIFRWDGAASYIQINDAVTSADQATQLATARDFSLTGDVTATTVSFNGTGDVALSTSVTQAAVTQHQAALSITESQISDLQSYLTAETDPVFTAHTTSSITDGTGLLKNDGAGNWSYDNSTYLTSYTETNDLSSAVTWANVPDANITQSSVTQHQAALSITESQISDLGSYLTDLTGSSVGTLSDVDFNSVTLDGANGQDKVLAWDQTAQAFVPVDQTNTNTTTFGLAGNTGTHTFDMVGETLTFLGTTNQIDIEVANNFINLGLASVVDVDLKGSVFADDSSLIVNGVDGTLAYTATTPTDWNGTAPTTVGEAIDRLAALVKTLNGGTGA